MLHNLITLLQVMTIHFSGTIVTNCAICVFIFSQSHKFLLPAWNRYRLNVVLGIQTVCTSASNLSKSPNVTCYSTETETTGTRSMHLQPFFSVLVCFKKFTSFFYLLSLFFLYCFTCSYSCQITLSFLSTTEY